MGTTLHEALASVLGRPPREDILRYLEKRGLVRLLVRGQAGLDELEEEYLELERTFPHRDGTLVWELAGDERTSALSRILAAEADRTEEVIAFRTELLGGKLVPAAEVASWMEEKGTSEPGLRTGKRPEANDRLTFYDPETAEARSVRFSSGGVLAELQELARQLGKKYTVWEGPEIVCYILTGRPPGILLGSAELRLDAEWPAASRAILIIDPVTPAGLVADLLRQIREIVLPEGNKRTKTLSLKHIELSVAAERKHAEPERPWDELVETWNSEHPDWAYVTQSATMQFSRDCRAAWTRVTGRDWE